MSRATLRVRLGVTAACVMAGVGLTAAPAFASNISPVTSPTLGPANPPRLSAANPTPSPSPEPVQLNVKPVRTPRRDSAAVRLHNNEVRKVITEARRQRGKPYSYGADGPGAFDCSGLVRFVFLHSVHRSLPHNASQQYHSLRHIQRRHLQIGDLVFVDNGGYISHVGIYDGHGYWWVAPHTGTRVQRQKIYQAHFVYARVLVYHKHVAHHRKK